MSTTDHSSCRKRTENFDDFLDRIWGEYYSKWASVFPAGILSDWQHMDAAMKTAWRLRANVLHDEVAR